jgi:hypothetical protein
MIGPTTDWRTRLLLTGVATALAIVALATISPPAQARVWVSAGVPCCGYYPGPYYGYGYPPPPYAYVPPPGYYPPPDYGAPGAYPPAGAAPSAYTPGAPASGYAPPSGAGAGAAVTYTNKPAFTNAAGQTCRQYKTTDATGGHPVDVYGTACQQADGQWRVVN